MKTAVMTGMALAAGRAVATGAAWALNRKPSPLDKTGTAGGRPCGPKSQLKKSLTLTPAGSLQTEREGNEPQCDTRPCGASGWGTTLEAATGCGFIQDHPQKPT